MQNPEAPMWHHRTESIENGHGQKIALMRDGGPIPYSEVIGLWQADADFRTYFTALLTAAPYRAFRWETPSITVRTVERPFECVLLDDPSLDCAPEPWVFAAYFANQTEEDSVLAFPNLGNDAVLVVPRQLGREDAYGHLAAFLRQAPGIQTHALWRQVGLEMQRRLTQPGPTWLSTAGGGVAWLHVRLDTRSKYYRYIPYRAI